MVHAILPRFTISQRFSHSSLDHGNIGTSPNTWNPSVQDRIKLPNFLSTDHREASDCVRHTVIYIFSGISHLRNKCFGFRIHEKPASPCGPIRLGVSNTLIQHYMLSYHVYRPFGISLLSNTFWPWLIFRVIATDEQVNNRYVLLDFDHMRKRSINRLVICFTKGVLIATLNFLPEQISFCDLKFVRGLSLFPASGNWYTIAVYILIPAFIAAAQSPRRKGRGKYIQIPSSINWISQQIRTE